jgi:hypothetical protein
MKKKTKFERFLLTEYIMGILDPHNKSEKIRKIMRIFYRGKRNNKEDHQHSGME